jgi:hypothetical protein
MDFSSRSLEYTLLNTSPRKSDILPIGVTEAHNKAETRSIALT